MISAFVVDASVAVKWFVPEEGSADAEALAASGNRLIAPRLLRLEVANAFRRKIQDGMMVLPQAHDRLDVLAGYLDHFVDEQHMLIEAMNAAAALRHPIYDILYLETARRHDAVMVTADRRLIRKLGASEDARLVCHLTDWHKAIR